MDYPDSNEIIKNQNKEKMLCLQYAARHYYNVAERINYALWACCFGSYIFSLFDGNMVIYLIMALFDVGTFVLSKIMKNDAQKAADLRELFDIKVLGFENRFSRNEVQDLMSISYNIKKRKSKDYKKSIVSNAYDNPPGIKDWYVFSTSLPEKMAQLECQNQNRRWDKALYKKRKKIYAVIFSVVVMVLLIVMVIKKLFKVTIINSTILVILWCLERIKDNKEYDNLCNEIDIGFDFVDEHPTEKNLKDLQEKINKKRRLTVFGMNMLYKKKAKDLSEQYKYIT